MTTLSFYRKLIGHREVTTRSAAQLSGMGMSTASMALRRLEVEGLVSRIKPGAWLVGTAATRPGALVSAAAHPYKAYLSGWSALRHHGRIQQLPRDFFGVTLGRPAKVELTGATIRLHHITPALFDGYTYEPSIEGLVASPEKAFFDVAYFSAMNRSRISGSLPETDLNGFRWSKLQAWLRLVPKGGTRTAVERGIQKMRARQSGSSK